MAPPVSLNDQHDWDDSALIHSWESALDEYKKYHSIQAQGKRLEDVLTEEELILLKADYGDLVDDVEITTKAGGGYHAGQMDTEEPEANGNAKSLTPQDVTQAEGVTATTDQESLTKTVETKVPVDEADAASMPQAVLGTTAQDENLKNLMMAWYYAGYYTGIQQSRSVPGAGQ